jgi:hypothetical protein
MMCRDRLANGDAFLHFYDYNGKVLRPSYMWHPNWRYEVIIRQFETVDGMLGIVTAPVFDVGVHLSSSLAAETLLSQKDGVCSWIGKKCQVIFFG